MNNSGFDPERREKAKKYASIGYRATFLELGIGLLFPVFFLFDHPPVEKRIKMAQITE